MIEQLLRDIFDAYAVENPGGWLVEFGRNDLWDRIYALWRERYPEKRNRPAYRHVSAALRKLVAESYIERRQGETVGMMYRKASETSLVPRPGETAEQTVERVSEAARRG